MDALHLDQHPRWHALLHYDGQKLNIRDPAFLLSGVDGTPRAELLATVQALYGNDPNMVCRFPARYEWLRSQFDLPELPLQACTEIQEFEQRAPSDRIVLVFASENVVQPSSMMGHAFLKLEHVNPDLTTNSHGISFFTEAQTLNFPKLMFDSTVTGKPGFFQLGPYQAMLANYLNHEQRTIWEFPIKLSAADLHLLRMHLIELKHAKLTYFFQDYNCATVVNFILAVGNPAIDTHAAWLAPVDVVKRVQTANAADDAIVVPPPRTAVRVLGSQLDAAMLSSLHLTIRGQRNLPEQLSDDTDQAFIAARFAQVYNDYLLDRGDISTEQHHATAAQLKPILNGVHADRTLNLTDEGNPAATPGKSQIRSGFIRDAGASQWTLGMMPTSHQLSDDNRRYGAENALSLFDTQLKYIPDRHLLTLDYLTIYGARSHIPYDTLAGGMSGEFRMAIEDTFNGQLEARRMFNLGGGIGLSTRVGRDMDLYMLSGGKLAMQPRYLAPQVSLEAGLILREVFNMKSIVSIRRTHGWHVLAGDYSEATWTQSTYLSKQWSLQATVGIRQHADQGAWRSGIELKRLF
ncbi:DUF4105 domain-containing protein [Burkholderiaceae bacterium DAT-1]|nr:DUF4105 domain-containing protein [Burkholderiaceae bacterium DAT-1]